MNLNTLTETLQFFAMTSAELIALFFVVSFMVAMMQEYVPASTVQRLLTGRGLRGNIVGAGLGAVTPFCSCSTIPVTVGLLNAGAPFGATMSFLVSSPILNPVILGLLVTLFGWKFTVFYGAASFVLAVAVGAVWQLFGLERDVKKVRVVGESEIAGPTDFKSRLRRAGSAAFALFKTSLPYLLIGVLGGGITLTQITGGQVPEWVGGLVISGVVLAYVTYGGMRGTIWVNVFQTVVLLALGFIAFWVIVDKLGGLSAAIYNEVLQFFVIVAALLPLIGMASSPPAPAEHSCSRSVSDRRLP